MTRLNDSLAPSRRIAKGECGSSLIETALLAPVLLLLLVVAVDFGRAYSTSIAVNAASENGALYGVQNVNDVAGMILAAKLDSTSTLTLVPLASFGCECSDGSSPVASCLHQPSCVSNIVNYVEVDTTAVYTPLLPYPGVPSTFLVSGKARMRAAQ